MNEFLDDLKLNDRRFVSSVVNMKYDFARQNYLVSKCAFFQKREIFQDLAPLLWHSFGTIAALLQVCFWPVNRKKFECLYTHKGLKALCEDTLHLLLCPCSESLIVLSQCFS